jgi:phosphoribosylanthranilate isomerase
MSLKLKVCGMREVENIRELEGVKPDFMGMIFYDQSPRDVSGIIFDNRLGAGMKKVGVFVNAKIEEVLEKVESYGLDYVQLHGDETVSLAADLNRLGIGVIKVFRIDQVLPIDEMEPFIHVVDYFLFDTQTKLYGGSGKKFNWNLLQEYSLKVPYFLSGGIGPEDLEQIKSLKLPGLFAIDINSQVEVSPGRKDIEKIKLVKELL